MCIDPIYYSSKHIPPSPTHNIYKSGYVVIKIPNHIFTDVKMDSHGGKTRVVLSIPDGYEVKIEYTK